MYSMTIWYDPDHPNWFDEGIQGDLRLIREAGFTHINWNPDAGSSYMYSMSEMMHIKESIEKADLRVKTIHGANGCHHIMEIQSHYQDRRKDFISPRECFRQTGIELVENRLLLAKVLNSDNIVMHIDHPAESDDKENAWKEFFVILFKSLDQLRPIAEKHGVRIAVENLRYPVSETIHLFDAIFDRYPADYLGWCYDSGHAHFVSKDLTLLERYRDRVIATHLHDNYGARDDHLLPGDGNMDWNAVVQNIAASGYELPLNYETPPEKYSMTKRAFYTRAFQTIEALTSKVETARRNLK